ncbi:hypothetical protein TNCV_534691 [Trichonephila clavipes]|nr:hypothetical protein TNCV_534691 [Trichonephila clavipes]
MMWGSISSSDLLPFVVLKGMITGHHIRSILADHFHPIFKTLFPGRCSVFQNDNPPPFHRCTLNLSRAQTSSHWCGVVVRRGVPAQVSSTSLEHGSKLHGPSPKALV